jgi:hypothetical protein
MEPDDAETDSRRQTGLRIKEEDIWIPRDTTIRTPKHRANSTPRYTIAKNYHGITARSFIKLYVQLTRPTLPTHLHHMPADLISAARSQPASGAPRDSSPSSSSLRSRKCARTS